MSQGYDALVEGWVKQIKALESERTALKAEVERLTVIAEKMAEAAKELNEYVADCMNWEEDEVKPKKWWHQLGLKYEAMQKVLSEYEAAKP